MDLFGEAAHPTRVRLLPLSWMASSAGFGLLAVQVRLRPVFRRSSDLIDWQMLLGYHVSLECLCFLFGRLGYSFWVLGALADAGV